MSRKKIKSREGKKQIGDYLKKYQNQIFFGLLLILGVILIINIFSAASLIKITEEKIASFEKAKKPAEIQLYIISPECDRCSDVSALITRINTYKVNITDMQILSYNADRNEATELIERYDIVKLPALIVFGEIEKISINGLEKVKDALVFRDASAPYFEIPTGRVKGLVSVTLLRDKNCKECVDISSLINSLKEAGVSIVEEKNVEKNTEEATELIEKYSLKTIPTLIISRDLAVYNDIAAVVSRIASIDIDGNYILASISPPYLNLSTNRIEGLVKLTMIVDKQCDKCYNASAHKPILERFGVYISKEETIDYSSMMGKNLISKYNIKKIPTILLSKEANVYNTLTDVWKEVGSIEKDGVYVFRSVEGMGTYRDLSSGQIVLRG
jgi:thioredoxin-related protein